MRYFLAFRYLEYGRICEVSADNFHRVLDDLSENYDIVTSFNGNRTIFHIDTHLDELVYIGCILDSFL